MNLRLKQILVAVTILIAAIGFTYAAIPNNTLQNDWLVVSNVNATTSYNIGTNTVIDANREATFTNLTLSGDLINTYNVTEQLKYPHQPASYIIWTDGTNYYAKNGTTEAIDYSGNNATTVIQNTLNAMSVGQIIYIKNGLYVDVSIAIPNGIRLIGESMYGTILNQTNTAKKVIASEQTLGSEYDHIGIENLQTNGGSHGIILAYVNNGWINNVKIINAATRGTQISNCYGYRSINLIITSCNIGLYIDSSHNANFYGTVVTNSTLQGIYIIDTDNINLNGVDVETSTSGYGVELRGVRGSYTSGYIEQHGGAIYLYIHGGTVNARSEKIRLESIWMDGTGIANDYGIYVEQADYIEISDSCYFQNITTDVLLRSTVTGIDGNIRQNDWTMTIEAGATYTKNYGETEASNGDYIAHLLDSTPDHVFINVQESDAPYVAQAYNYNSTHFQLYLYDVVAAGAENTDKTIEWSATYEP